MHDPNYVFPDSAIPEWVRRYSRSAARRHDTFVRTTGTWLPGSGLADRLNLGGMRGIGAVALALLRAAAPGIPSLWRLD